MSAVWEDYEGRLRLANIFRVQAVKVLESVHYGDGHWHDRYASAASKFKGRGLTYLERYSNRHRYIVGVERGIQRGGRKHKNAIGAANFFEIFGIEELA